jgi:hypothetical protein
MTTYQPGDYVYPTDLPRRFVCRVIEADSVYADAENGQILRLHPMTGPWPEGTFLVRLSTWVAPVKPLRWYESREAFGLDVRKRRSLQPAAAASRRAAAVDGARKAAASAARASA